jgi:hypothetical protein
MESFDLVVLFNVDETVMRSGELIVVSKFNYYRK